MLGPSHLHAFCACDKMRTGTADGSSLLPAASPKPRSPPLLKRPPPPPPRPPPPPPPPPTTLAKCGNGRCDAGESCANCPQDCSHAGGAPCERVGVMYSVWCAPTTKPCHGNALRPGFLGLSHVTRSDCTAAKLHTLCVVARCRHWPAWNAMRLTRNQGRTSYTVEDVIRSQSAQEGRGGVELGTTYTPGVVQTGLSFYWQHRPSCESLLPTQVTS